MAQNLQRRAMAPAWSIGITIPARAIFHLIIVVAMLALFAGHARAGVLGDIGGFFGDVADRITGKDSVPGIPSDASCRNYAREAAIAAQQNEHLECGNSGDSWNTDPDPHFNWCKTQNTRGEHLLGAEAKLETKRRDNAIRLCSRCNAYAAKANAAAHINSIYHCGGTGGRWGSGDGHKEWCMRDRESAADAETRARDEVVNQCLAGYTREQDDWCRNYMNEAVRQAKFNAENHCGGKGPRWTKNKDKHFAFCTWGLRHDIDGTNRERDARAAENQKCQAPAQRPSPSGGKQVHAITPPTSTMSAIIRDNSAAAPRIPRQPPAVVAAAPREPILVQPVVTGGTEGAYQVRPVVVPALPTGSIGALPPIRIEGTIDPLAWKHKLPPDLYRPKSPSSVTPATGETRPGTGGWYPSKRNPPTPGTTPATGGTGGASTSKPGTPPATGGSGGINLTKPIPSAATPNASSDLYLRNSRTRPDSSIASRNKPLPADLFKPKGSSGLPPVKSYGTKADSPIAWKHRPIRPAISRPTALTGALPIRSNATAGSVATKTPVVLQRRPAASSGSAFARRAAAIRAPSAAVARARPSLVK